MVLGHQRPDRLPMLLDPLGGPTRKSAPDPFGHLAVGTRRPFSYADRFGCGTWAARASCD